MLKIVKDAKKESLILYRLCLPQVTLLCLNALLTIEHIAYLFGSEFIFIFFPDYFSFYFSLKSKTGIMISILFFAVLSKVFW